MAAPRAQPRRRFPRAAVAGITMPPLLRRSPASVSSWTRTRSCSIRTGVLSVLTVAARRRRTASGRDAADEDEQAHEAEDAADDHQDAVGAGVAVGVDEDRLELGDPALRDVLRAGALHELVDGRGEPFARLLHLPFEGGVRAMVGHGVCSSIVRRGAPIPSDGTRAAARRTRDRT